MTPRKGKPRVQRGKRRKIALPARVRGEEMRSKLEARFAHQLEARGIAWQYEPERIGAGHYLVDFYLPDLACWVEVKGRFEPRDSLLLPNVAINLKRERGERLFLYMPDQAYRVGGKAFTPLSHEDFWRAIQESPA